ncbi:MAG TPA: TSCPD domain-containing protein [Acidiphilium sp.]|nr:TSCPD domain-containing protein [Acidiphilium sp.]HQU23293.1 TSCPD domain-containing protein [Acidiphilium sp.]
MPRSSRRQVPAPWRGVRLATLTLALGEDGPMSARAMIPASWPERCAAGLLAMRPPVGSAPVHLIDAAMGWIRPLMDRAALLGLDLTVLHAALRDRCAAPSAGVWRGEAERVPGFVLNLPQFIDADGGFDQERFGAVAEAAVIALALIAPEAPDVAVGVADLALFLAQLDLDYGSEAARERACAVAALLAAHADWASARLAALGLRRHRRVLGILPAGAVECLLGVETIGIAAPMSALDDEGHLARWAQARLAARGQSAAVALARSLAGHDPFGVADAAAVRAMVEALTPYFGAMPDLPVWQGMAVPRGGEARRAALPARRAGYTQKVSIGGHKFLLRTGEYPDGRLGEVFIALPKESAAVRGFADSFAIALSVGLQHDVPLAAYLDALADSSFGAAGVVEGDPAISHAASPVDYVCKHLGANYLGRQESADPMEAVEAEAPLLPLDLPEDRPPVEPARPRRVRAHLKLVS